MNPLDKTPQQVADEVARTYFGVTDEASRRRVIRQCLVGAVQAAVLVPGLFYLRFGRVGPLGWGSTVFFVAYLLLTAIALYFRPRTEYHSPVLLRGDWLDRVGAFWLVGCVFGPLLGWIITSGVFPVTQNTWRWPFGIRVFLGAGLPLLLALPLTRYVRGKSTLIALPLLICMTLLAVSSAMNASRDLSDGPVTGQDSLPGKPFMYLRHTGRALEG